MVFMKMTLTCSGLICLIENKLSNVTMKYLICVISILVSRKDLHVLGHILFFLYVNDINQHVHIGAVCNLYADDTLVYCSANNVDTLRDSTNNSIACIKQWYDMNRLVINTAK